MGEAEHLLHFQADPELVFGVGLGEAEHLLHFQADPELAFGVGASPSGRSVGSSSTRRPFLTTAS